MLRGQSHIPWFFSTNTEVLLCVRFPSGAGIAVATRLSQGFQDHPHLNSAPNQSAWSSDSDLSIPPTACPTNFSSQTAGRKPLGASSLHMLPRSPGGKVCVPGRAGRSYERCVWLFVCECICICTYVWMYTCLSVYLCMRAFVDLCVICTSVCVQFWAGVCYNVSLCECL